MCLRSLDELRKINLTEFPKNNIPEVGKKYHVFDDGKITWARHFGVICKAVVPFDEWKEKNPELLENWKANVNDCDWVYNKTTDYIIECEVIDEDQTVEKNETFCYTRDKDGDWFGFGTMFDDGCLDVTRELWNNFMKAVHNGEFEYDSAAIETIEKCNSEY